MGKNNARKLFFNFLNFFSYFFGIFSPGSSMSGIRVKNSFLSFSAGLIPIWQKITPESCFFNFLNLFAIFFQNFLSQVEYERNSGLNFCSLFLDLSHLDIFKNNVGKLFFNFLNFFAIFF